MKRSILHSVKPHLIAKPVILLLFIISCACNDTSRAPLQVNYPKPIRENCAGDTTNKYHILVPSDLEPDRKIPLIILLDAHGDGLLAVSKFIPAVRYFPCLVAGSDLIQNNFAGFEDAIVQMRTDIENKYPVDEQQIIIGGFSGGARMAYYFALKHPVKGLLMCGAGPGEQAPACPVYVISGLGDFNFSEEYRHPDIQSFTSDRFTSDYFHGIHEWPQAGQLSDALLCLLGDNHDTDPLRKRRSRELVLVAGSLEKAGDDLMAWQALEKAARMSQGKREKNQVVKLGRRLLQDDDFRNSIRSLEADLNTEARLKQAYAQRSLTEGFPWWKNELTVLNRNLEKYSTGMKADHFLRIKGFIGILLYSRVNSMIHSDPANPQLEVLLQTYAFAEPENPDVFYFKALHAFQSGDRQICIENLEKSLKLGFSDKEKMRQAFPKDVIAQIEQIQK